MMPSLPLLLASLLLCSSHVFGFVTVPLPSIALTMRSTSPDTNTHDLLSDTMVKTNAYLRDYFTSYYNVTGSPFVFSHVNVNVKTYGIVPTSSSERFQTGVEMKGYAYYKVAGETAANVKTLVEYALNDKNRVLYVNSFLKVATNDFLQGLTAMEVTVDNVLVGATFPPLPPSASTAAPITSAATSSTNDVKKSAGISSALVVFLVVAALVAFFVVRRRRRLNRGYKQTVTPPPPQYSTAPRHYGGHPAFSFARRNHPADNDSAVTYAHTALGSPSAIRSERDEELAGGVPTSSSEKNRFRFDIDGEEEDERTEEWKVIT